MKNKFYNAIQYGGDPFHGRGYINKVTLQVIQLGSLQENYKLDNGAEQLTPDVMADRRKHSENPEEWIQIPLYDAEAKRKFGPMTDSNVVQFAKAFLNSHGLPVNIESSS